MATPAPKTDEPRLVPSLDHDRDQDQEDPGRALQPEEEDHEAVQDPVPAVLDVIEDLEVDQIGVLKTKVRMTDLGYIWPIWIVKPANGI